MNSLARKMGFAAACGVAFATANAATWNYETTVDRMTSKKEVSAVLVSDNDIELKFPYIGKNYGQLTVRNRPGEGTTATLVIVKGQIMCSSYDCDIRIRFDNDQPMKFGGNHPADRSSNAVFLTGAPKFIERAKRAKKILVQFTAFNQGTQLLEFAVGEPLEWPVK